MRFFADFHIHSKYSRATSPQMNLECLDKWAKIKGIKVLGTGDFTHPQWLENLKEKLKPAEKGLYSLKSKYQNPNFKSNPKSKIQNSEDKTRFILTSEISCIYSKGGKVRKIHIIIFAPDFETVKKINIRLSVIGNLKADGRPILGLDVKELLKIVLDVSENCLVVPAHLMTPWFSLFGSKSGFDSVEECFEEYSKYIYAGETGLSADPEMLWRMPDGRRITLISNSDAHSPSKIGREANFFDTGLNYPAILDAIKEKDPQKFLYTIEFFPEEGKYHYDGHRLCGISSSPPESKRYNNLCPVCGRPLVIGVLNRVEFLSDKAQGFKPRGSIPFRKLISLEEIIIESLGVKSKTRKVEEEYNKIIDGLGNEFKILLEVPEKELRTATLPEVAEGIIRVREGRVNIEPGYDGVYGKINIFSQKERKQIKQ